MKLTEKDKQFLETLHRLIESAELWVEFKAGQPGYLVLRGNYGDKIHRAFGMTRQGVRWRFQRLMDAYISSFETVLFVELLFGSPLRKHALHISKHRYALRQRIAQEGFQSANSMLPQQVDRVENKPPSPSSSSRTVR